MMRIKILMGISCLLAGFAVSAQDPYLLNPGDILSISVWNEDALQQDLLV
jgi:protein involved in polysaccharide export with SLBB domain